MTAGEAARKGHAGGYILRVVKRHGMERYLADYRRSDANTTTYPALAERFEYKHQAREMAKRAGFYTSLDFEVTTVPAEVKPCRCKVEAPYVLGVADRPCPDCGNDHTAKVGEWLRCFKCGNAWQPEAHAPEDDGLTDEQVGWAMRAAAETVFPELDDDALDRVEAEIKAEMGGGAKEVAGCWVP